MLSLRPHFNKFLYIGIFSLVIVLAVTSYSYISAALSPSKTVNTSDWQPSSPDPSDLTLLPNGNILVADAEVDEMSIYAGANLYEITKSGALIRTYDTTSFSHEPTGVAVDPTTGHWFISDDDLKKIFDVDLGTDGIFNTQDDVVRSIDTTQYNSNDPEGISIGGGYLYIADGTAKKIVIVGPGANGIFDGVAPTGDDNLSQFYTSSFGQNDPEGVWYKSSTNTLFIVSNSNNSNASEVTISGVLVRQIDISSFNSVATAGVLYATSSESNLEYSLYIVDRGIDNNTNPSENDGKLYELPLDEVVPPDHFSPFGTVTVTTDFELNGAGTNVDTIAFWEAPDPANSLMFVTSKGAPLVEVWKYPYNQSSELTSLTHSCITGGTNGIVVDQNLDLLYVSIPHTNRVCVYSLPNLSYQNTIYAPASFHDEPNLALMNDVSGQTRLYVSDDTIVYKYNLATDTYLGDFTPQRGLETMWGDNIYQRLLIPDENDNTGVYAYDADGNPTYNNGQSVFGGSVFNSDAEGIFTYTCPSDGLSDDGRGFIMVSDQLIAGNDYEVFDRKTWEYLGKVKVLLSSGAYVGNTDGIASTQQTSINFPKGIMAAIQSDTQVVGVRWEKILDAANLRCEGGIPLPSTSPTATPVPTPSPTPLPPGETILVTPISDSYVRMNSPATNYGTSTNLVSSNYSSTAIQYAYFQFDLRAFAGQTIIGAKLIMTPILERTIEKTVKFTDTNWTESTINWNNKPIHNEVVGSIPSQRALVGVPVVATLDASQINSKAGTIMGLVVDNSASPSTLSFKSREATTEKPLLEIKLLGSGSTPLPSPTPTSTPVPTDPPTPTPTSTPEATTTPLPTATPSQITLTPIEDVHVRMQFPTKNYGTSQKISTSNYSSSKVMLSFLKFNLSGINTISSAELVITPSLSRLITKDIKQVTNNSWSETTMNWNNKPTMGSAVGLLQAKVVSGTPVRIQIDPVYLQGYLGGNVSLGIDNVTNSFSTLEYYSKEAGSNSPKLIIYR